MLAAADGTATAASHAVASSCSVILPHAKRRVRVRGARGARTRTHKRTLISKAQPPLLSSFLSLSVFSCTDSTGSALSPPSQHPRRRVVQLVAAILDGEYCALSATRTRRARYARCSTARAARITRASRTDAQTKARAKPRAQQQQRAPFGRRRRGAGDSGAALDGRRLIAFSSFYFCGGARESRVN